VALPSDVEAAKDAFAAKHGLPPEDARTLEAFFTHLVLLNRNLSDEEAVEVWKHKTSCLVGGSQDTQIDAIVILLNNEKVLRPGDSLDELDMAVAGDDPVQLSFIFIQATGSASKAKGVSQKISAFSDGVLAFLKQRQRGEPGVNAGLEDWIDLKNRIFDILEDGGMEKCCDCAMYFVSPRRSTLDENLERTTGTGQSKIADDAALEKMFNSVRFHNIGLGRLGRLISDAGKRRGEFKISLDQFVRAPAPRGVEACYCGYLTVGQILEMISDTEDIPQKSPQAPTDPLARISQAVFASNIRQFVGSDTPVNASISQTIRDEARRRELGLRSNGLAITARGCQPLGSRHLVLRHAQIVNGCQTSHVLFAQRELLAGEGGRDMWLPAKIVVTDDAEIEGAAILGLNRQTPIHEAQVFTERAFADRLAHQLAHGPQAIRNPVYFEKREGEFRGRDDIDASRIVSLFEIAQAYAATFEGRPDEVAGAGQIPIIGKIRNGTMFGKQESASAYVLAAVIAVDGRQAARRQYPNRWLQYPMKHMLTHAMRLIAERRLGQSLPEERAGAKAREAYLARLGGVFFENELASQIADLGIKIINDSLSALGHKIDHKSARSAAVRAEVESRIRRLGSTWQGH
jgi:hypothetical protein